MYSIVCLVSFRWLQCQLQLVLLLEPPHFGKHQSHKNPHHTIRKISSEFVDVASVALAAKQEPSDIHRVGIFRRKLANHVHQFEIRTDQTVDIQAGGLATTVADLYPRMFVRFERLVVVRAIHAHIFSAHGVGKGTRTAIIVAGGFARLLHKAVFSSMPA